MDLEIFVTEALYINEVNMVLIISIYIYVGHNYNTTIDKARRSMETKLKEI